MSGIYTKDGLVYTKTRTPRTKVVYESGKVKSGIILNPVTLAM